MCVYVIFGVPKRLRRIYKLWEEGQPPASVFEFTSRSTALEDRGNKKALCENIGVRWYRPIEPDSEGRLHRVELGVYLQLEKAQLLLTDTDTGQRLLRPLEADQALRQEIEARRQEAEARRQAETRVAEAEAELARLRNELARLRGASES